MIPGLNASLQKLKIWKKEKYQPGAPPSGIKNPLNRRLSGAVEDYFEVMFNPETYSLKYVNQYSKPQGINTVGKGQKYHLSQPQELRLKLMIDGTGVSSFGSSVDVYERVQSFLKLTAAMEGEKHKPNLLVLAWGNFVFECVLREVEVSYTMFDRAGLPLRAELNTAFIGSIEDAKRVKQENKKSPDLTRERVIQEGDKLVLIAAELYQDSSYYLELARVNGLNNFRKLKPGSALRLPPVNK